MNVEEQVAIIAARIDTLADVLGIADSGTRQLMALVLHPAMRDADTEESALSMAFYSCLFDWNPGSIGGSDIETMHNLIAWAAVGIAAEIGERRRGVIQEMYANLRAIALPRDAASAYFVDL